MSLLSPASAKNFPSGLNLMGHTCVQIHPHKLLIVFELISPLNKTIFEFFWICQNCSNSSHLQLLVNNANAMYHRPPADRCKWSHAVTRSICRKTIAPRLDVWCRNMQTNATDLADLLRAVLRMDQFLKLSLDGWCQPFNQISLADGSVQLKHTQHAGSRKTWRPNIVQSRFDASQ